jgi:cytochrome P450
MNARAPAQVKVDAFRPVRLGDPDFIQRKFEYYAYLREHLPVHRAKLVGLDLFVCARYEDCLLVVKDDRFGRNRNRITGGSRLPFPAPRSVALLAESMIVEDDPEHRRLRNLVQQAFTHRALAELEPAIEQHAHDLLDRAMTPGGVVDLQRSYALPIPMVAIAGMVGIKEEDMPTFQGSLKVLTKGMTGLNVLRTLFWDLRKVTKFVREQIERKRQSPGDDILSRLIEAEAEGDTLSENELISMVFLLIIAGYETTAHLITNGVLALLQHPSEMQRLREQPQLTGSAVEEILRFCGPVHGTKLNYAKEEVELRGVTIPRGSPVMPLLGSANRDEAVFEAPEVFDIRRDPNRHLAFSQGNHFCLGASLARMEARIAFRTLLERAPDLRLGVPPQQLKIQRIPGWHRYAALPVRLA